MKWKNAAICELHDALLSGDYAQIRGKAHIEGTNRYCFAGLATKLVKDKWGFGPNPDCRSSLFLSNLLWPRYIGRNDEGWTFPMLAVQLREDFPEAFEERARGEEQPLALSAEWQVEQELIPA